MPEATDEVLFEVRGVMGLITLNRPRAINALNSPMVLAIQRQLDEWLADESVRVVVLTGSGDRGLCAGGDIVAIFQDAADGLDTPLTFWREEYALDVTIARYPKPFVALMDGIVLGGGIGLSAHSSHRVVTERSRLGMPEVTIGFVPDVGGTYLYSRAPGELGTHLGLTGGMAAGADAIPLGLADYYVPSEALPGLIESLETTPVEDALAAVSQTPPDSPLMTARTWIDDAYSADSVTGILDRLTALGTAEALEAAATIRTKAPLALSVTLESLRRARRLPGLDAVLEQEFRVSARSLTNPDMAEGIRAQVIDKDRNPRWNPATLADVDPAMVADHFEPRAGRELQLPRAS